MENKQYKAFISYRHQSPDQEIAQNLHSLIENFGIPSSLKKSLGVGKMGRVFRDQEELQLSASLGDDIHEALDNSEWLICICSPRYLESNWCLEELRYFIDSGRRDRVLAILVEGEPADSFPEMIRLEEKDGTRIVNEPLAADVRGKNLGEQLKKLKSEKLRIMAPMLGVDYDDLRQRARQRRNRMIMSAGVAVILLLSGFLGFAFHKNRQITAERNAALIAESEWLAQSANEALDNGDKMLSLLLSLEALPTDFKKPERPVTEDALESLRSAIISGQGDNRYVPCTELTIPGLETYRGYNNTVLCFSRESEGFITAWIMSTGAETDSPISVAEEPAYLMFANDPKCFCVYDDRVTLSNATYPDHVLSEYVDWDTYITYDKVYEAGETGIHYTLVEGDNGNYVLVERYQGTFSGLQWYQTDYRDYSWMDDIRILDAKPVGGTYHFLLLNHSGYKGTADVLMVRAGYEKDNVEKIFTSESVYEDGAFIARDSIDVSCDGTLFAENTYRRVIFWNIKDQEPASVLPVEELDGSSIKKIAYAPTENSILAIMTSDGHVFLYDCVLGEVTAELSAGMSNITDFMWNTDGSRILMTCDDGRARLMSAVDGQILQTLECGFPLEKATYAAINYYDNAQSDNYILLAGGDHIKTFALEQKEQSALVARNSTLIVSASYDYKGIADIGFLKKQADLTPDGDAIWCCIDSTVYVADTGTMELKATLPNGNLRSRIAVAGQRFVVTNEVDDYLGSDNNFLRIYDTQACERLAEWHPQYAHRYLDDVTENLQIRDGKMQPLNISLNKDETRLAVYGYPLRDPSFFVYDMDSLTLLWHVGYDAGMDTDRIFGFAKDWEGYILPRCDFMPGGDRLLCVYAYTDSAKDEDGAVAHRAFEIRDTETGEVLAVYSVPYETLYFREELDRGILLIQDTDLNVHLVSAKDGTEILSAAGRGEILSYAVSEDRVFVTYKGKTKEYDQPVGHELFFDGTARETAVKDMAWPVQSEGIFGDRPYVADQAGIYDAETGAVLMRWPEGKYIVLNSSPDGSKLLCYATHPKKTDSSEVSEGDVVLLKYAEWDQLRDIALKVLDGRELTDEQKKQYHLE